MTLLLSHRIDRLSDFLAERLELSPFSVSWILLPSLINKQWLMVELVKRLPHQALCGVTILSWREALSRSPELFTVGCSLAKNGWDHRIIWRLGRQILNAELYDQDYEEPNQRLEQIHCFCLEDLPPQAWQYLTKMAPCLSIYQFSPCRMFWEDLCTDSTRDWLISRNGRLGAVLRDTHPLLANWGSLARTALKQIQRFEPIEDYPEIEGERLLHQIQRDLLNLRTLEDGVTPFPLDSSVQLIAAGVSKLREVQILKENIHFPYSEILVLAPDIRAYTPFLQFVFGEELRIASTSSKPPQLLQFFTLIKDGWEADDLFELLEEPEDRNWARIWLKEAEVWKGWEQAVERMLSGLVFLFPEGEGPDRISTIDWGEAERLLKIVEKIQELRKKAKQFATDHTLREWAQLLREDASFAKKLLTASLEFPEERFSFDFINSALKEQIHEEVVGAHLIDAIQCQSLTAGSIRPAQQIFLLGMDQEHFPRHEELSAFDWPSSGPDRTEIDRSLLLQILFAAKEQLTISYCDLSAEDGQPIEPALPVQELIDLLESYYGIKEITRREKTREQREQREREWPKVVVRKPERWFLSDLNLLAQNPWRYFLHKSAGCFPKKEPLFTELALKDRSIGAFGIWNDVKLQAQENLWKKNFLSWGETIHFEGELVGTVERALPGTLFLSTDLTLSALARAWPSLLAVSTLSKDPVTVYSLKTGKSKTLPPFNKDLWFKYALLALESPSPLIAPWIEDFLKRGREVWLKEATRSVLEEDDEAIRWIVAHHNPLPLERIWEEWHAPLQEVFCAFL